MAWMELFEKMGSLNMSKLRRLAGYGIGDFGLNIYWNTLSLYLIYWYTTVVGLRESVFQ